LKREGVEGGMCAHWSVAREVTKRDSWWIDRSGGGGVPPIEEERGGGEHAPQGVGSPSSSRDARSCPHTSLITASGWPPLFSVVAALPPLQSAAVGSTSCPGSGLNGP
jgi:hypothetical protein